MTHPTKIQIKKEVTYVIQTEVMVLQLCGT